MKLCLCAAALYPPELICRPAKHLHPSRPSCNNLALLARLSRAEGALKVAVQQRYAIEQKLENLAYGVAVQSTQPAGRVISIYATAAKRCPASWMSTPLRTP